MAITFAQARTFLRYRDNEDGSTRADEIFKKIANQANIALRSAGKWDFDKRFERLTFAGEYSTGTVSVSAGGTTVTGSGTTFTTAMVGRYIRFNGEDLQYKIATFVGVTEITIEAYQGESNLSAVTYQITDERQALPARFRDFASPLIDDVTPPLRFMRMEQLQHNRLLYQQVDYPRWYSVEWQEDSSIPQPYMWLYPAPQSKRVILLPYYAWPPELTADGDYFRIPVEAEPALFEFLLAFLYREQGRQDWTTQLQVAEATANTGLSNFRAVNEAFRRQEWHPDMDPTDSGGSGKDWDNRLAPGEPAYE